MALTHKQVSTLLGLKESGAGQSLGGRGQARIRLIGAAADRPVQQELENRRVALRLPVSQSDWEPSAFLRPGLNVRLVDIARGGALVEAPARIHLGARTELHLTSADGTVKLLVPCVVRRCLVASLAPMRFHTAVEFDVDLDSLADLAEAG